MSRIPGSEKWSSDLVRGRIEFLVDCAKGARRLSQFMTRRRGETEAVVEQAAEISGAAECWSDAAALAFASNHTAEGLLYLARAAVVSDLRRCSLPELARSAFFGSLAGYLNVRLSADGIRILPRSENRLYPDEISRPWSAELGTAIQIARSLPVLALAAAVSGNPFEPEISFDGKGEGSLSRSTLLAAFAAPDFRALRQASDSARAAIREMEETWELRLTMMREDTYHWERARARTELIDWRLLAVHVALLRRGSSGSADESPGPATAYLRDLAGEIHKMPRWV